MLQAKYSCEELGVCQHRADCSCRDAQCSYEREPDGDGTRVVAAIAHEVQMQQQECAAQTALGNARAAWIDAQLAVRRLRAQRMQSGKANPVVFWLVAITCVYAAAVISCVPYGGGK